METFEISGVVRSKGNSQKVNKWWQYSLIEIGDQVITSPRVPMSLDVFIEPGANVKLLIGKKFGKPHVVLVQREDGKSFYANGFKPAWWYLLLGIMLIPVLMSGVAVIFAYFFHKSAYDSIENAVVAYPNKDRLPLSV